MIDDKNDSYHFVKVLISNLPDDFKFNERIPLARSEANWKKIVVKYLKEAFRSTGDVNVSDMTNKQLWIRLLATTQLLNNSRSDGKILGIYGDRIVLYGTQGHTWNAYGNVVLDEYHYLPALCKLINDENKVTDCKPVKDTRIFSGWDIHFCVDGNMFLISSDGKLLKRENGQWEKIDTKITISENTSVEELRALLGNVQNLLINSTCSEGEH